MMLKEIDLFIHSARQLCPVVGANGPQRGEELGNLGLIEDGAVAIDAGKIVEIGRTNDLKDKYEAADSIDAGNYCILPGLVDAHTHIPWQGDRAHEFEQRVAGASYMEIMAAGGGIMSTVRQTRSATLDSLVNNNLPRLRRMLQHGTTSADAKTGYGLSTSAELKQLQAIARLNEVQPVELSLTFLPAHAIPTEFAGKTDDYVDLVVRETLPAAAQWAKENNHELFCDVFCEAGVFDVAQTRRIFTKALDLGYRLKIHADEFEGLGGTALAVEMGAVSADHLVQTPETDIKALGKSDTIAVGLPGTPFGLAHQQYTPAQAILQAGGALALATDCNPGTCWCESMQMVIALACRYMGLTQAQAIVAATLNAAYAIGRGEEIGSLDAGKQADLILLDIPDYRQIGYRFGTNLVKMVIKKGNIVVNRIA